MTQHDERLPTEKYRIDSWNYLQKKPLNKKFNKNHESNNFQQ